MTTPKTDQRILDLLSEYGMDGSSFAKDLLAALQARDQQGPIKTWQQRLEETCPALGPMHIHACVEEVNDAMQAEIDDLRAALQEQTREGVAVAPHASDAITWTPDTGYVFAAPQPAQPVALPLTDEQTRDLVAEAIRKQFVKLGRYSFLLDDKGNVRRVRDKIGHWVEFVKAHELFDPVCVDAALATKPLTDQQIYEMYSEPSSDAEMLEFARAIEAAHGIGGGR